MSDESTSTPINLDFGQSLVAAPPQEGAQNVMESIQRKFALSAAKASEAIDERIDYVCAPAVVPSNDNQPTTVLAVTMYISAITPGDKMHGTLLLPNFFLPQEALDEVALDIARSLRDARSQHIAQTKAQAQSTSGLIAPGN